MAQHVVVGAHPWVYAATREQRDIYPILEHVFSDMSYAGYDGVELMPDALTADDGVEKIRGLSKKHSLSVIGCSFGGSMWDRTKHDAILREARLVVERLAALGGRTLGVSVGHAPAPKTAQQLDTQAELLSNLITLCEEHDVVLNLHNHTYEVQDNEHDLNGTLARLPHVKLGPDLNWLLRGGVDPVDFIRRHRERIVFLHLRDQKADGTWPEAMGEGDMDYAAIGRALSEIGFGGDAVVELAHERGFQLTRPLRDSLRMSRGFVRRTLGY